MTARSEVPNQQRQSAMERRAYIAGEVEHLLDGRVWPGHIAATLGYRNVNGLVTCLRRWGYVELADRLNTERVRCAA